MSERYDRQYLILAPLGPFPIQIRANANIKYYTTLQAALPFVVSPLFALNLLEIKYKYLDYF